MREIKFRAWSARTGMWSWDDLLHSLENKLESLTESSDFNAVMQFTGLKDKTGKEIYEGDRISLWHEEMFFQGTVTGIVEYDSANACFQIAFDSGSLTFNGIDIGYSEIAVIGNIYENPNKMKGES